MSQSRNHRLTTELTYAFILENLGISDPKRLKQLKEEQKASEKAEGEAKKLMNTQIKQQTSSHASKHNHSPVAIQQPAPRGFKR